MAKRLSPDPHPRLIRVRTPPVSLAERIRALRLELAALEEQQRDELFRLVTEAFPQVISALQIWQQPALRAACLEADLATVKQLGLWLRSWSGSRLDRIGRDNAGTFWESVSADDLHEDAGVVVVDDV